MKRVLILWADERSPNLGVRVLAEGTRVLVESALGPCHFTLQDFAANSEGFVIGRKTVVREALQRRLTQYMRSFDLVIDTGAGDSFTSIYGARRLTIIRCARVAAKRAGVPVILGPQTIGPFEGRVANWLCRSSLPAVELAIARDSRSLAVLQDLLPRQKVALSSDVVFALPVPPALASTGPHIVLNVSGLLWNSDKHGASSSYRRNVRALLEKIGRTSPARVTLLAHVLDNDSTDNDVPVIKSLAREFPFVDLVIPSDLQEARRAIANSDCVVASRMHASLNAISQGVPAISWAYSRKFAPLMSDIDWSATVDLRADDKDVVGQTLKFIRDAEVLRPAATDSALAGAARLDAARSAIRRVATSHERR